jgi:putative hydrolase
MNITIDTHTHSVASLHAYSTIDDLARGARRRGLAGFVLTEHGPALQGFPHPYYFGNLRVLPRTMHGVSLFKGVELNIMDDTGGIDLDARVAGGLDFVLAGLHEACFAPRGIAENTRAIIAAIKNPCVHAISHPANPAFPVDFDAIAAAAAENGTALEINNSSFTVRRGSDRTCPLLAQACAARGTLVCCGSDAHYKDDVGNFRAALAVIKAAGIRPENVVNRTLASFTAFIGGGARQ